MARDLLCLYFHHMKMHLWPHENPTSSYPASFPGSQPRARAPPQKEELLSAEQDLQEMAALSERASTVTV